METWCLSSGLVVTHIAQAVRRMFVVIVSGSGTGTGLGFEIGIVGSGFGLARTGFGVVMVRMWGRWRSLIVVVR